MISLKEWLELVDYKITEGSDYFANIPNLYSLSSWNEKQDGYSFNVVFSPQDNQRVYCVEVCDYAKNKAYRLKDSEYQTDNQAWDGVDFVDLDVDDDFIQKGLAIRDGQNHDTRVQVPLDLDDRDLFDLMKLAHERDLTLNQLVEALLRDAIDDAELYKDWK